MRGCRHDRPPCGADINPRFLGRSHSFRPIPSRRLSSRVSTWPLLAALDISTRNLPLSLSFLPFQTSPTSRRTLKDARPCRSSTSHPIPFRGEKKIEGASNLNQSATLGRPNWTGDDLNPVVGPSVHLQFPLPLSPLRHTLSILRLPQGITLLKNLSVLGLNDMSLTDLPEDFGW